MISNETLFYGGIVVDIIVLILVIIFFVMFYIDKIKLNDKFDREYGKELKPKRRKRG